MKDEEQFLRDFDRSNKALQRFVEIQNSKGINMVATPSELRGHSRDRRKYSDKGDGEITLRFEHKKINTNFTRKSNFPQPNIIVDEVYNFEQKKSPWLFYVIENKAGTHTAVVHYLTQRYWFKKSLPDRNQNRPCEFYMCPIDKVHFCPIDKVFKYIYGS